MPYRPNARIARVLWLSALLALAPAVAHAGPPLLCHPFDLAGEPSLPWGDRGWNAARRDYDPRRVVADTLALLRPQTPVVVRMETLRRAAIYAAADGARARALADALEARVDTAGDGRARALAQFDAGYFAETVQEIVRLQDYDMPGIGKVDLPALRALLARGDGSRRIARAIALQPDDPALRFGAALVSLADLRRDDYAAHAAIARAGARRDRLLARNLGQIAH